MKHQVEHINIRRPTQQPNIEHVHKEHPDDRVPLHKVDVSLHNPQHKVDELQQRKHTNMLDLEEHKRRSRNNNTELIAEVENNIAVPHKPVRIMLEIATLCTIRPASASNVLEEIHKNKVERRPPHKLDAPLETSASTLLCGGVLLNVLRMGVEIERRCLGRVVPIVLFIIAVVNNDLRGLLHFGTVLLFVGLSLFLLFLTSLLLFLTLGYAVRKLDEEEVDENVEDDQRRCDRKDRPKNIKM